MDILNTTEAAKLLRMSEVKLRELATAGVVPGFRLGPRWRFRRSHLEEWVAEQVEAARGVGPEVCDLDGGAA